MTMNYRDWMEMMFETLEPSIVNLIEYGVKADPTQVTSDTLGACIISCFSFSC